MIEIYVDEISERLVYTFDFIFSERGQVYKLNNDFLSFEHSTYPKFNYSKRHFDSILQLIPADLLFDESIENYEVQKSIFESEECLSFNHVTDPFASVFYVLSRMEEYTNQREDVHGRFSSKFSIQHEFNWLHKAVCDRWAVMILRFLSEKLAHPLELKKVTVKIKPTFDVDNTFAYQWKQGARRWLSIARDRIQVNKKRLEERKKVERKEIRDPYDTFDYIDSISDRGFEVTIFWLVGDYATYDKNISYTDIRHQKLIGRMGEKATIGLHPSYKSNSYASHVLDEKLRLEQILERKIEYSRQHFLKLKVRITYPNLVQLGFKDDFSMGYADQVGFRCGTARPHFWFDLAKNQTTDLIIHPFVYMDGTLNEYLKLTTQESKNLIWNLYNEVLRFGGDFSFIWHNETIGNYDKWRGWDEVLEYTLSLRNK